MVNGEKNVEYQIIMSNVERMTHVPRLDYSEISQCIRGYPWLKKW